MILRWWWRTVCVMVGDGVTVGSDVGVSDGDGEGDGDAASRRSVAVGLGFGVEVTVGELVGVGDVVGAVR